jgi:hypothetical protein
VSASPPARKKRVWKVGDFATHAGISHRAARRLLLRLNAKHGGGLLTPSEGANREYTFLPSALARLEPDYFSPVESLEFRLEEVEEAVTTITAQHRRLAVQTGENTRQIAQLSLFAEKATRDRRPASTSVGR